MSSIYLKFFFSLSFIVLPFVLDYSALATTPPRQSPSAMDRSIKESSQTRRLIDSTTKPFQIIKGVYVIEEIKKRTQDGSFEVFFRLDEKMTPSNDAVDQAQKITAPPQRLFLLTDNIHLNLKEQQRIRLSGQIVAGKESISELTQVLVYLPIDGDRVIPVWLMSTQFPPNGLTSSKYLEMHAPSTDYQVL